MSDRYDEISLKYWSDYKIKAGSSKSYVCYHNGYVYGDDMKYTDIEFVHVDSDGEMSFKGNRDGIKDAYFKMVQMACSLSDSTTERFLNNSAEKFRIYNRDQVLRFSEQKRNSTRIKDDSCKINVGGTNYYVANNLKICEYFNSASMNIEEEELDKWFIRIHFENDNIKQMEDSDEVEPIDDIRTEFILTLVSNPSNSFRGASRGRKVAVNVDFNRLNIARKRIGDLGESIVLNYEMNRLIDSGRCDLASRVEHTSREKGDGYGYDIKSFTNDGKELYIEVKATKQNRSADFYLSKKEKEVANEMFASGKAYLIYRVFKLNERNGTGELAIYSPPFDDDRYDMQPENWKVRIRTVDD